LALGGVAIGRDHGAGVGGAAAFSFPAIALQAKKPAQSDCKKPANNVPKSIKNLSGD
jgi:hypothetical protein